MSRSGCRSLVTFVVGSIVAGCAGSGEGLDANGDPVGSGGQTGGGTVTADFQSIQDNVFTPICTRCHIGAGAPEGLQLDAAHSYALLVGVPSNEVGTLLRVRPGDPDHSYLLLKLQGSAGIVGSQMPLGGPYLPQPTIDAIRQWIANGAVKTQAASTDVKRDLTRALATPEPFAVTATSPEAGALMTAPLLFIEVAFNHEVDASLVNSTTVVLETLADGVVSGPVAISTQLAESNPSTLVIRPSQPLGPGVYRLTLRGTGGAALADVNAQTLGSDLSFLFTVGPAS
jgi:hypothetical protein